MATLAAGMPQEASSDTDTEPPPSSVEDVAFCPTLPLALTASLSGAVGVWDVTTQKLRHKLQHQVVCVCVCVCVCFVCVAAASPLCAGIIVQYTDCTRVCVRAFVCACA